MRPACRVMATTALMMASAMARDTMVFRVAPPRAVTKYCIGAGSDSSLVRSGAPRSTAVVGMSSAATVIASDHMIALAMPRAALRVSSAKYTAAP